MESRADATSAIGGRRSFSLKLTEVTFSTRLFGHSTTSAEETRRARKTGVLLVDLLDGTSSAWCRSSSAGFAFEANRAFTSSGTGSESSHVRTSSVVSS